MATRKGINPNQIQSITSEKAETLLDEESIDPKKIERIPPIPFNETQGYQFISHRLGFKPSVRMILDTGDEIQPGINHINTDECEITWIAGIRGEIIVN